MFEVQGSKLGRAVALRCVTVPGERCRPNQHPSNRVKPSQAWSNQKMHKRSSCFDGFARLGLRERIGGLESGNLFDETTGGGGFLFWHDCNETATNSENIQRHIKQTPGRGHQQI